MNARSPLVAVAAVLALAAPQAHAAVQVWTATATEKIRPATRARTTASVEIAAARNEYEAFQIGVSGEATGVSATASDLSGPGGTIAVRLYRAALITLANASAVDGGTGAWPDALVPAVDEILGEPRRAFPFSVPAGESRAIWAEVHVPAEAGPGTYSGAVTVTWDGGGAATVPVTLTVWPFAIPSTASLKTAFGLTYGALPSEHAVSWWGDDFSTLRARYGQLALEHRVSLSKIDDGNPDLEHLTTFYGAEMDGTLATTLAGARLTSFEFVGRNAYAAWASWFAAREGWTDRLFQYTCDEPPLTCSWEAIPGIAAAARSVVPPLRTLVTTTIHEADAHGVTESIDVLAPVVNFMDDRPGSWTGHDGNQRAAYDSFLAASPRRELWLYQSCMSHGCGGAVDIGNPSASDWYFTGWPTYVIDSAATRNRAMEWLSFKYRATGELYYEVGLAYGQDPWSNQWNAFSGNGDGTLFYPGTPARIGGASDVPVASIRLKMIREGMEDYEYLHILEGAGDGAFARQIADGLFPNAYSTEVAPEALYAARAALADRIVALGAGGDPGPGGGGGPTPPPRPPGDAPGIVPIESGCASASGVQILALAGLAALALRLRRR
ncbi:MAG TPA: glycoside hydrolase domain-containing protein [Anaeromyxobacter sp.]|nr:glycoside hydrolase domain-containing protein [Anaeromyxobacter sp.]